MKNYFESDDPIQEVGRKSIFGRLKSFEESDEYNFEKEMNEYELEKERGEYEKTYSNHQANTELEKDIAKFVLVSLFIIIIVIPSIFFINLNRRLSQFDSYQKELPIKTSLGSRIPELNDEQDKLEYYMLSSINFDKAGSIITLYKYDKETKANWCNFTENDSRFNGLANTFQINYEYIPQSSKNKLKSGLIAKRFEYAKGYQTGSVYALNKKNNCFLFVLISENDIIYGTANGKYQDLFGE